jgi:hypothetical protein
MRMAKPEEPVVTYVIDPNGNYTGLTQPRPTLKDLAK